jgi:hypothetical protein
MICNWGEFFCGGGRGELEEVRSDFARGQDGAAAALLAGWWVIRRYGLVDSRSQKRDLAHPHRFELLWYWTEDHL